MKKMKVTGLEKHLSGKHDLVLVPGDGRPAMSLVTQTAANWQQDRQGIVSCYAPRRLSMKNHSSTVPTPSCLLYTHRATRQQPPQRPGRNAPRRSDEQEQGRPGPAGVSGMYRMYLSCS